MIKSIQNIIDPKDGHIKCVIFTKSAACGPTCGISTEEMGRLRLPDKVDHDGEYEDFGFYENVDLSFLQF
jgi:hypothetical protein